MYLRYPVRNFRCPFCGARMRTEEYKGWKPWVCPGCSKQLQFSTFQGCVVQLLFLGVALLALYLLGLRGWQLFGAALLGAFVLTVVLIGPLDRVLPRRLEPYRPPPWKQPRFVTLFPDGSVQSDERKQGSQVADERPKDP